MPPDDDVDMVIESHEQSALAIRRRLRVVAKDVVHVSSWSRLRGGWSPIAVWSRRSLYPRWKHARVAVRCEGRPPYQVFKKGIRKPKSRKKSTKKEVKTAA